MDLNVLEDMRDALSEMRQQRDELAAALRDVFALMDDGWLVRDISNDGLPGFATRELPYVRRLATSRAALEKIK